MTPWGLAAWFCISKGGGAACSLPSLLLACSFVPGSASVGSILWAVLIVRFIPLRCFPLDLQTRDPAVPGPRMALEQECVSLKESSENVNLYYPEGLAESCVSIGFGNIRGQRKDSSSHCWVLHCKVALIIDQDLGGRHCNCPRNRNKAACECASHWPTVPKPRSIAIGQGSLIPLLTGRPGYSRLAYVALPFTV